MLFFIIFGTRGVTLTGEKGDFHCPQCGPHNSFKIKKVRRFFTLYFIPIIPLDLLGEYLECSTCQGTFNTEVRDYDPSKAQEQIQAVYMVAMKQAMICTLLADGVIDDEEVKAVQEIFEELSGIQVTEDDLREEIMGIQRQGEDALELLSTIGQELNDSGKEKVIVSVHRIAAADGHVDESEIEYIHQLGQAMGMSPAHVRGVLAG